MSGRYKRNLAAILVVALVGCSSMKPVGLQRSADGQAILPKNIRVGDTLRVSDSTGRSVKFKLTEIDGPLLRGTLVTDSRVPLTIHLASIDTLEVGRAKATDGISVDYSVILPFLLSAVVASTIL